MSILLFLIFPFQIITGNAQGTTYTIKYVAENPVISYREVDSIFTEIDKSLSLYLPSSRINQFNSTGSVIMDGHMKKVIEASLNCYRQSMGAFDITSGALSALWGFSLNGTQKIPRKKEIKQVHLVTGSNLLYINGDTLVALKKNVRIDCNGIAQGYTVDVLSAYLESRGIEEFMVELGGEIIVKGNHPDTEYWRIGIEYPNELAYNFYSIGDVVLLKNKAITTSSIKRKAFDHKGKTYAHIIDPRSGSPIKNEMVSVTVIADNAITADAWDNAFMVMGIKEAKQMMYSLPDIQVSIIYKNRKGSLTSFSNIKK